MTGFKELKAAYEYINKEFGFYIFDVVNNDTTEDIGWKLIFKRFAVGIDMGFAYEFLAGNDPYADDIFFNGNPNLHFSIACYRAITDFIETMQKHRSDKDTMIAFIDYLKEQM